jgi:nitrate reductase (NAD(P)H)
MPPVPWRVRTTNHPGSSLDEIEQEPNWETEHQHEHRVGYKNRYNRQPGVTHEHDEQDDTETARAGYDEIARREEEGDLVNFRDIILNEKDLHLRHPENRSLGDSFCNVPKTVSKIMRSGRQTYRSRRKKRKPKEMWRLKKIPNTKTI